MVLCHEAAANRLMEPIQIGLRHSSRVRAILSARFGASKVFGKGQHHCAALVRPLGIPTRMCVLTAVSHFFTLRKFTMGA